MFNELIQIDNTHNHNVLGEKRKIRDNFPIKMYILINNKHAIDVNTSGSDFERHAALVHCIEELLLLLLLRRRLQNGADGNEEVVAGLLQILR